MLAQAQLVITEIMYNPPESGTDSLEYIEIYNSGSSAIDLDGHYITFAGSTVRDSFSGSFVLPAGGIVVTAVNDSAVRNQFNLSFTPRQWRNGGGLSNSATSIRLFNAAGVVLDSVAYASGWVTGTNAQGRSMILCNPATDNNLAASWAASNAATGNTINSVALFGSPGVLETCPATAPANDNCTAAISLTVGATCVTTTGTVANATQSLVGCAGDAEDDVWYSFVATNAGANILVTGGANFDGVVEVFSGACATPTSIICVDNTIAGAPEAASLTGLTVGQTYLVRVYDYQATATSTPSFTICVTNPPPAPANDNCANAVVLTQAATCTPTTGDVASATQSLVGCSGDAEDDVWYSFVATATSATVTVAGSAGFDAVFEVRSGACGAGASLLCEDNTFGGGIETNTVSALTIGQTYYIRVHDWDDVAPATTTFTICVTSPAAAPANDNCAGAFNLTAAAACTPTTGTVTGATQSLAGCQGTAGDDVWFRFTATTPSINLTVAGSASFDAVVEVFSGTCAAPTSINCTDNDGTRGGTEVANLSGLTVGQTYFVRVYDWYTPAPATPTFTICAQTFIQCNLTAPTGAILEGEACGDSTNNGCANVAPTYGNISCGQTVFGNAWANGNLRDVDYYRFTLGAGDTVRWNVNAEFPALIAIASIPLNNCDSLDVVSSAAVPACTPTNLTTFLATPGTYYAIVVPSVFTGFACGTNNDYIASFSIGTPNTIATTNTAAGCVVGGTATATVSGSAAPYTYLWSNSQTAQTATGLMAGTYMVTATNSNSCRVMSTATVTSSAITLTATPSSTATTCGAGTGTASVVPTNGVAPYTYLWSGARTGSTITGLTAGSYNVTITDANGCRGIITAINVANPSAPTATISSTTNVACFGDNTGTATISAAGGAMPYTFSWSNSNSTTNTASALAAGSFSVTVNDNNNCAVVLNDDITEPAAALAVTAAVSSNYNGAQISCFAATDGQAQATTTGGTGLVSFLWNNNTSTATANNLAAGTYMVTATDANGCTAMASTTLTAPTAISITVAGTNGNCQGQAGSATAAATGGTGAFTYDWSNGDDSTLVFDLNAGMYTVTATDANGCNATGMTTITGGAGITAATIAGTNASTTGAADGAANLTVTGGLAPFTYAWSNGATTEDISGLVAGTYTVTVTDGNGCTADTSVVISQPVGVVGATAQALGLRLFPNPTQHTATLELSLLSSSQVNIEVYNVTGQVLFSQNAEQIGTQQYELPVANFAQGVYFVKVRAAGQTATQRLIIARD